MQRIPRTSSAIALLVTLFALGCDATTPNPSITLTLGGQTLTLTQGQNSTVTVTVDRSNFTGAVGLSATGLPTGVTASFNPVSLPDGTTGSVLTLTAAMTAATGAATVTVTASGTGVESKTATIALTVNPAPSSISASLSAATLAVTQGASGSLTVTVGRTNFTGAVDLAASGLPSGVTASFNPTPVPNGTATSTLTLTATSTAAPGTATVTVTASGAGVTSKTATFALTVNVAGSYTLAMSPASVTLSQGASQNATVTITRTGGFSGTVTLAASGLPAGVTAAFNPSAASGTSSTLTLTATSSATTGTVTVTVTGTTPGLGNQTTTFSLTVQAPGSTTSLSIDFCTGESPLWFAYQNEGAAWTRVTGDANLTFTFNATSKVGLAFVTTSSSPGLPTTYEPGVIYATTTDLLPISGVACVEEQGTKTLNGSVAGLGTGQSAGISMASSYTFATPSQLSFSLTNLPNGALDLIATRSTSQTGGPGIVDRLIIRRGLNMTSGATIPVLDFAATEAVAPASAGVTATGMNSTEQNYLSNNIALSARTYTQIYASPQLSGSSFTGTFLAVPSSLTVSGDMHSLSLFGGTQSGDSYRYASTFFRNATDKSLALGAVLSTPVFTKVATTPYIRFRAQLASQPDYNFFVNFDFDQTNRNFWMGATANYFGGVPTTWDLTMPDFSGVAGWDNTWALQAGQATDLWAGADGGTSITFEGVGAEGTTIKSAGRSSTTSTTQMSRVRTEDVISRVRKSLFDGRSRSGRMK